MPPKCLFIINAHKKRLILKESSKFNRKYPAEMYNSPQLYTYISSVNSAQIMK